VTPHDTREDEAEDEKALPQLQDVFKGVGDAVPLLPYLGDVLVSSPRRRRFLADGRPLLAHDSQMIDFRHGRAARQRILTGEGRSPATTSDAGRASHPYQPQETAEPIINGATNP
jgi:hypothetical protein